MPSWMEDVLSHYLGYTHDINYHGYLPLFLLEVCLNQRIENVLYTCIMDLKSIYLLVKVNNREKK
jgi:hypothetical protein